MPDLYPLLLLPDFRERVWGAHDLSPIYPNHKVEGEPIGEVWLTGDECRVANGPLAGQTLGDLAKRYGRDLVGEAAPDPHRFPLLLKFLFPREKLSVQVHPDDETARRSGLPHGKSECWYVVSAEIHAQVGLGLKPGTSRAEFEAAVRRGGRADALLNWIYVKPGEMIYNPAGTVHAIGPGSVLLEVQQNS
ncbi:MAG: type I phosphomannose isomerase catalytic subunit, partial [Terriglobales bacterium]